MSYVAGFVVLVAPGGLGVRELVLEYALRPRFEPTLGLALADAQAVVVALILRLTWTIAEVVCALGLYAWKPGASLASSGTTPPGGEPRPSGDPADGKPEPRHV